jgi:hypothetical protein
MALAAIDVRTALRQHERFLRSHDAMVAQELETAGEVAVRQVQHGPQPFKDRTGNLRKQTDHKVLRTRGGRLLRLLNRAPYAAPIDKGSRRHTIRARRKPYLVFYWEARGRWVRTKQVNHPGNKPYRFLFNAHTDAFWFAGRGIQRGMRQVARTF